VPDIGLRSGLVGASRRNQYGAELRKDAQLQRAEPPDGNATPLQLRLKTFEGITGNIFEKVQVAAFQVRVR